MSFVLNTKYIFLYLMYVISYMAHQKLNKVSFKDNTRIVNIFFWIVILLVLFVLTPYLLYIFISEKNHIGLISYFGALMIFYLIQNRRITKMKPDLDYAVENRIIEKSAYLTLKISAITGMVIGLLLLIIDMITNATNEFSILFIVALTILGYTVLMYVLFILIQWKPLVDSSSG